MYCAISKFKHAGKPNSCIDERGRGACGKEGKNFAPLEDN